LITDCHVHIQPFELLLSPPALELMRQHQPEFERVLEYTRSPKAFLHYMDQAGLDRAVLINAAAPEVTGFPAGLNALAANYAKEDPQRLISCGSFHPRHSSNAMADIDEIVRLGLRLIKIHPPHQLFYANDYLKGLKELELLYRAAQSNGIPVMFHTGTSIFPGARNKYGDPIYVDDVAVDFPRLKIVLAHGGRPLWMDTAFFLVRRHPNVYLDISSIPPKQLLNYFPRLPEIAQKTMFGSDWPGPGVRDLKQALDDFRALPLAADTREQILGRTALSVWP
jgi:predicted TIM-barrel fold metal-dependent hydrolase